MKRKLNSILIIDDDPITNFIHTKVIESAGVSEQIETRLNGQEALDYLTEVWEKKIEESPRLILLDINMPLMDGWEFLEAYQNVNMPATERPYIVMLTASSNPDDYTKALTYPVVSAVKNKPLTADMLNEIVSRCFNDKLL